MVEGSGLMIGVSVFGSRVWGSGFMVYGRWSMIYGPEFRVECLGFRVQGSGSGFRIQG